MSEAHLQFEQVVAEHSSIKCKEISLDVGVDVKARKRAEKDKGKYKPVLDSTSGEVNTLNGVD